MQMKKWSFYKAYNVFYARKLQVKYMEQGTNRVILLILTFAQFALNNKSVLKILFLI